MAKRRKRLHYEHVNNLKKTLNGYGIDPFSDQPPRHIANGTEIAKNVAEDMIKAGSIGEKQFDDFVSQRLITHSVAFFSAIKRNNLKTGIKKVKPSPKAVTILKEDCQAFGVIISKSLSLSEAFQHPITSLPLSIATPDGELRQSDKASLRNFLKDHAKATSTVAPKQAAWFVDGLASIRTFKRKETYEKWMEGLL